MKQAFSLPELLVVVFCISLALLLMVPLSADLTVNAGLTGCRSHMRQIGMIFHTYARDREDGEFPLWRARSPGSLNNQYFFANTVRHLATNDYTNDTRIWICPSDEFDGPFNNIPVQPAESFFSLSSAGNLSYVFMAGHRLNGTENPSTAFVLADESNQGENGALTPGNMPPLSENDNHGANIRNVLYLDLHVAQVNGPAVNAIFDGFANSQFLQAVD
ncbi:MAG TPA: hypothetical protein PJ991_13480 [Kiritimatiellia bacterium]|nr:hypothetical protein [Kiritimatiellia bacterium]